MLKGTAVAASLFCAAADAGLRRGAGPGDRLPRIQPFVVILARLFLLRGACFTVTLDSAPKIPLRGKGVPRSSTPIIFDAPLDGARILISSGIPLFAVIVLHRFPASSMDLRESH